LISNTVNTILHAVWVTGGAVDTFSYTVYRILRAVQVIFYAADVILCDVDAILRAVWVTGSAVDRISHTAVVISCAVEVIYRAVAAASRGAEAMLRQDLL